LYNKCYTFLVRACLSSFCHSLRVRSSPLKQSPGYQVELVVQLVWVSGEPPQQISSLAINSCYGLWVCFALFCQVVRCLIQITKSNAAD